MGEHLPAATAALAVFETMEELLQNVVGARYDADRSGLGAGDDVTPQGGAVAVKVAEPHVDHVHRRVAYTGLDVCVPAWLLMPHRETPHLLTPSP